MRSERLVWRPLQLMEFLIFYFDDRTSFYYSFYKFFIDGLTFALEWDTLNPLFLVLRLHTKP